MSLRACFVSASGQNVFFAELTELLRGALADAGVETSSALDHFPAPEDHLVYVVVPHEFTALTDPAAHPTPGQLRRTVVVNTEQPGTAWFEEAARTAFAAGAAVDINPAGARELRLRGVDARVMPLGYPEPWDLWRGASAPRRVDLAFLGGYTPRRAKLLAACAPELAGRRTEIRLADNSRPVAAGSPGFLAGETKWSLLADTKILLNVHRDTTPYFEWQRVVEAVANGCVVVSEHSLDVAPLEPNVHFVSVSVESIPFVLAELLEDQGRLEALRHTAYETLRGLPLASTAAVLREAVETAAENPVADDPRRATRTVPRRVPAPPPPWVQVFDAPPTEIDLLRRGLKTVLLTQRRLERRLERLEHGGATPPDEIMYTGPYARRSPRVSIVVTLYNYEQFVAEALTSAALSEYEDIELVVIDDRSTDGSLAAARDALAALPWVPAKLVARGANRGLPAARNLGLSEARGELVFTLDADNALYPHAVGRLVEALDEDPKAAFAYGILETFDVRGYVGLLSWGEWDRDRLRHGNYIDAMALLRRSALEAVGGYPTDARLYGWEDFALWCDFAQRGRHGVHVPEIVGRYRTGPRSMIGTTNIDTAEAWSLLLEQHAFLRERGG
jgi:hypothetical protein